MQRSIPIASAAPIVPHGPWFRESISLATNQCGDDQRDAIRPLNWLQAPPLIQEERQWRERPAIIGMTGRKDANAVVTAWSTPRSRRTFEASNDSSDASLVITYARNHSEGEMWFGQRQIFDGRVAAQSLLITSAIRPTRAIFRVPTSVYRVYLPQDLLSECHVNATGERPQAQVIIPEARLLRDQVIERLVQALVTTEDDRCSYGRIYIDSLSLAICSRVMAKYFRHIGDRTSDRGALPKWRLRRVIEYIDASLDQHISLENLASAAGLTRMHFSAQFRARTGWTPHSFLLQRRIARAQDLLLRSDRSIAEIALDVGFQTQAHFTVVFKKVVGEPPNRWRQRIG
jgi:AraC-like DNA-binding protein